MTLVGGALSLFLFSAVTLTGGEDPEEAIEAKIEHAEELEDDEKWLDASRAWAELYEIDPSDNSYGFRAGETAYEAEECVRAFRYLSNFLAQEEPGPARMQKRAREIRDEIEQSKCALLSRDEAVEKARGLYEKAEELMALEDWASAADYYEDAYYLVPDKHGFAFKVGMSAHKAGQCQKAQRYLRHFMQKGDRERHEIQLREAEKTIDDLDTLGCRKKISLDDGSPPETQKAKGCELARRSGPSWIFIAAFLWFGRRRRASLRPHR